MQILQFDEHKQFKMKMKQLTKTQKCQEDLTTKH
jgi:hypothetical protein